MVVNIIGEHDIGKNLLQLRFEQGYSEESKR